MKRRPDSIGGNEGKREQGTGNRKNIFKFTDIDERTYDLHIKDDWWMTAAEAIQYGICDEIATEI